MRQCLTILLLALQLFALPLGAQEMKRVTGHIVDKTTGKPIDLKQVSVSVYGFNTVAQAEDVKKQMDGDENTFVAPDSQAFPDDNGYYEITIPETGALIFKADMKPAVLEKVNYRLEINVKIEMGNYIRTSTITAVRDQVGVLDPQGDIEGNWLKARSTIALPENSGKTNARMIVQPILIDGVTKDTLRYLKPTVMDGQEYRVTQLRRMNYNADNDPLNRWLSPDTLTSAAQIVNWSDTIYLENPSKNYQVKGIIQLEDYNLPYFKKEYFLASSRLRRPLRFLEYSMEPYMLDPEQYRERAKREKRNTAGNMSLNFMVGKAQLAADDEEGRRQIDSVKSVLLDIIHGEGSQLKEFHITGTASPDGPYAGNMNLAKKRMEYALNQIVSVLPKNVRDRVYMTTTATVAPWTAVAELLEADSLMVEAKAIRDIVSNNPGTPDRQWGKIRALPYYRSLIVNYLPRLRSVRYQYGYEIFRELTPEEILERYRNDEDYRSGRKKFALYEYWHLFQLVKEPEELEKLYKRAYDESIEANGRPWILAANSLAASYIARGVADTTILRDFIDLQTPVVNYHLMRMNGNGFEIVNPEAVVANQMIMYVMTNNFRKAGQLTNILPDNDRNRLVRAYALCLGGYYKGGNTPEQRRRAREVFETVSESSPLNKVVLCLAMNTKTYDSLAEEAMSALPGDSALTDYLWAVIYGRKGARTQDFMDDMASEDYLVACFHKDPSYIDIAAGDGDIVETIMKSARDRYENGE
ncbi:MAG: hypothetical protein MSS27_01550 [Bacteroides sp.]|nr:hypothetical protein [Bacteroides sp.]